MLPDTLRHIRTAQDVAQLFAELGYTAADGIIEGAGRVIARWRSFKVIAVDTTIPNESVRALARKLASAGERALAVAVGSNELAIAAPRIGQAGSTRVLVVPLVGASPPTLQQLESLRPEGATTALGHAMRVAGSLSTEAAGERFFTAFRMTLERMAASLDRRRSQADRRMAALLALTRVLFLYFVQAKGWLDGKHDYLRTLLDNALSQRRHFHRTALHPLFFGTLNRPLAERSGRRAPGTVPYLNGGLFEPHPVELRLGQVHFSNDLWRDAFDGLFERFRFCVREADEVDTIAPDMLGRVFERLMDGGERHQTGTFYTPETVVREIVQATIATALTGAGGLAPDVARRAVAREPLIPKEAEKTRNVVRRLKVLDPAAGSGAFLLGALECLTEIRLALQRDHARRPRWQLRRDILRDNLFGVDVNPIAVRLAELRLWLAVVADDPTEDIGSVTPLPNLDGVVRQGDTLLDPIGAARSFLRGAVANARGAVAAVGAARLRLFEARGPKQQPALHALRDSEKRLASIVLEHSVALTENTLRDLTAAARSRDLFGRRAGLTPSQRERHRAIKNNHSALKRALAALQDGAVPFFSFEVHAPDVLAAGGFTVIIGNPPWVRAERLSPDQRGTLRGRFSWWRSGILRGYAHLPDLSVAFLQRSLELTAPGGAVGLLLPSKVATAGYGEVARQHLVRETTITYVHRVSDRDAARFGATTYPLAVVARKHLPPTNHGVQLGFNRTDVVAQRSLSGDGPWVLVPDRILDALEQFRQSGEPLGQVAPPALGVKTGADSLLVGIPLEQEDDLVPVQFGERRVMVEQSALRPAIRGRDAGVFEAHARRVLIWGYDERGVPASRLPRLAQQYVQRRAGRLRKRADYRSGPPWTLFRTKAALAAHRVAWPDIARQPKAVVLEEAGLPHAIPLNTCYVAPAPDRETALAIAAVLNSRWTTALTAVTADEARGGYRRINARVTAQIPIPATSKGRALLAELSARAHRGKDVSRTDVDEAVAEALSLPRSTQDALRTLANDCR